MTNLIPGASVTVSLGHGGYIFVSASGGTATVTETPTGLSGETTVIGPSTVRQLFGPYPDGASILLRNETAVLDYDYSNGEGSLTASDAAAARALVAPDGNAGSILGAGGNLAFEGHPNVWCDLAPRIVGVAV